jgi:hypothetical protein
MLVRHGEVASAMSCGLTRMGLLGMRRQLWSLKLRISNLICIDCNCPSIEGGICSSHAQTTLRGAGSLESICASARHSSALSGTRIGKSSLTAQYFQGSRGSSPWLTGRVFASRRELIESSTNATTSSTPRTCWKTDLEVKTDVHRSRHHRSV